MQHTLIPYADRQRLHREYYVRVAIVTLCLVAVAIIIGAGALFPAYLKAWLSNRAAETYSAAARNSKANSTLDDANKELIADQALVDILATHTNEPDFSTVIRSVISVRGNSMINGMNLSRGDAGTIQIAVTGVSPTRDDLLALKSRFESTIPGVKIDLPIEQLAQSTNVPFSLQFSEKIK